MLTVYRPRVGARTAIIPIYLIATVNAFNLIVMIVDVVIHSSSRIGVTQLTMLAIVIILLKPIAQGLAL